MELLKDRGRLEHMGGVAYLARLTEGCTGMWRWTSSIGIQTIGRSLASLSETSPLEYRWMGLVSPSTKEATITRRRRRPQDRQRPRSSRAASC